MKFLSPFLPYYHTTISELLTNPNTVPMMLGVISVLKVVFLLVLLFCVMLGTFGSQFRVKNGDTRYHLYKVEGNGRLVYYSDMSFGCGDIDRNFDASLAFAIFAWLAILIGTVLAVIALFRANLVPAIVGLILAGVAWFCLLISWALVAALYNEGYCGGNGFKGGAKYDYGFAFLVISWLCTMCWALFEVLSLRNMIPNSGQTISTSSTSAA